MELRQCAIGFGEPALDPELLIAALSRHGGELRPDRRIRGALHIVEERQIQCVPGAIKFHQAVRWNIRLLRQGSRGVDQFARLGARLALGDLGFPTLLGFAVDPPVMVAKFAFRQFQRFFARQCLNGGVLDVDERC